MRKTIAPLLAMFALAASALGDTARPLADDPAVEARLVAIAEDLRCLVCQNESLASSRADLAEDLRHEVRQLIRQGKTDAEVIDFLVVRYGDFVRYKPPFKPMTLLLWGGPFVLLLGGAVGLGAYLRRRTEPVPLDDAMRRRAVELLDHQE